MQVEALKTLGALRRLEPEWRELRLPSPMQSPAWLVSWWEAYGEDDPALELSVLAVRDANGRLVGLAPWYTQRQPLVGKTIRFLGDGRAATDHHTILTGSSEDEPGVVSSIARWLIDTAGGAWRRLRFESLDADDSAMNHLERLLVEAGLDTQRVDTVGSFPVELPAADGDPWEAYLASLSKNRRKKLRRWSREWLDSGRATYRVVSTEAERAELWPTLVRLHGERREGMGEEGVFDDRRFDRFHWLASERLLADGRLHFALLEVDGSPAAIEYAVQDDACVYAYQGGISAVALDQDAGHLSLMGLFKHALATGRTRFDLLRGDEPYKESWGATLRPSSTLHARPSDLAGKFERWAGDAYRSLRDRHHASTQHDAHESASPALTPAP